MRKSFLERRDAKIIMPYRAQIEYGELVLLVIRHPSSMDDYYILQSRKPPGQYLLDLHIPKIKGKTEPGYFNLFGERIPYEKTRRSAQP